MTTRLLVALAWLGAVAAAGCYDPNKVVGPDEVLLLTATPASIPANGFSTARITVKISASSNRGAMISFTASGGTLSSTAARGPDGNGEASVLLTSDATPKTVVVTAEAKVGTEVVVSKSVVITFEAAPADSVLRLSVSTNQVEADGVSSVLLRAEANPAVPVRTVSFATTDGSFVRDADPAVTTRNNVPIGSDGVARAQLFAPRTVGAAIVTATSNTFASSETVAFTPALPDFISLRAEPLQVSRASESNKTDLTAVLSRAIGTVSRNTRVEFSVVNDASGVPFGRFQNVTRSNEMETATAQFVPGIAAPLGLATISARVPGANVTAHAKINIAD